MNNLASFLPLLFILLLVYVLMVRPAKANRQRMMELQSSLRPGMQVRTFGGLLATVAGVEDDAVVLEVAPGVHCRYVRGAIAGVVTADDDSGTQDDVAAEKALGFPRPAEPGTVSGDRTPEAPKAD